MPVKQWEDYYNQAHTNGLNSIHKLPGIACAFHSVIDGFIRVTPDLIEPTLKTKPSLKQAALSGCKGVCPAEIHSPEHFIQGLFFSLYRGEALQRIIRSESTYRWALETFGPGEFRLGGTSGNMARTLAPLGIPVTVYANPLTEELADLFGDWNNLTTIVKRDDEYRQITPKQAALEKGVFAIHWIFEYGTDFNLELDGITVHPERANRYIPSWNPRNNQFRMDPDFAEGFLSLAQSYSHLLFSGFHLLSERYPDGSTCVDVVEPLEKYLKEVKNRAPQIKIHLELASIASTSTRRAVLEHIAPHVHSVGLNETELPLFIETLGAKDVLKPLQEQPNALDFCQAIHAFIQTTGIERLHFHNLGYYLCLERKPWHSAEDSRDALLFAAVMAAARAKNGLFSSSQDIAAGLSAPIGDIGLEQLALLAQALKQPSIAETGIGVYENFTLTAVPTKLVHNPLFTVGLGDTISAGAFLTE